MSEIADKKPRKTAWQKELAAIEKKYAGLGSMGITFIVADIYLSFLKYHFREKALDVFKSTFRIEP
jgi:hypothetical protein